MTYPLKDSPYLSRESIEISTNFNINMLGFSAQKMLQAAELNELQEKFYKNESLTIQFYNKWLTKKNLEQNNTDIFGTSGVNFKNTTDEKVYTNTITPLNSSSVRVLKSGNIYTISVFSDYYRTVSAYYTLTNNGVDVSSINNNVDYIRLRPTTESYNVFINTETLSENSVGWIIAEMKKNKYTCDNFPYLKDTTGGEINAPCGASRLYLDFKETISTKIVTLPLDTTSTEVNIRTNSVVNNAANDDVPAKYLLAYVKNENGVITFYHSNGIKIQ
jgi:hypothetical protein